jgi:hypothetical protein
LVSQEILTDVEPVLSRNLYKNLFIKKRSPVLSDKAQGTSEKKRRFGHAGKSRLPRQEG